MIQEPADPERVEKAKKTQQWVQSEQARKPAAADEASAATKRKWEWERQQYELQQAAYWELEQQAWQQHVAWHHGHQQAWQHKQAWQAVARPASKEEARSSHEGEARPPRARSSHEGEARPPRERSSHEGEARPPRAPEATTEAKATEATKEKPAAT